MNLWKNFHGLMSYFKYHSTSTGNKVFRLLYKLTAVILIGFSILVTINQYAGDPIDCINRDDMPKRTVDNLCWALTTYSLSDALDKKMGEDVPYPGIDKWRPDAKKVYHNYCESVGLVLFLQGMFFFIPQYFWKVIQSGRVKNLIRALNSPFLPEDTKIANRKLLVKCMVSNTNNHDGYFKTYATAEITNFINVVVQIYFMDAYLGGEFSSIGSKVIRSTGWDSSVPYNPMVKVFPRLTKCGYYKYGSSGVVQRHDALCVLSINIIYEKIYIFLWFWFFILVILSGLALLYLAAIVFLPKTRVMVTRSQARFANQDYLKAIINKCKLEDWFLLDLLSRNLDPFSFRDLINDFASRLDCKGIESVWGSSFFPAYSPC